MILLLGISGDAPVSFLKPAHSVRHAAGRALQRWMERLTKGTARLRLKARPELWSTLQRYRLRSNSTGCSYADYWKLYVTIRRMRPAEILECGTGISTIVIATALKQNHLLYGEAGRVTSMEDNQLWFEHAAELLPDELSRYVEIVLSPQKEYREWIFEGVGYQDIPHRPFQLVFIDGPDDHVSPPGTPTVDLDYIRVLRWSKIPVLGIIDGRLATCFVYQALLGRQHVRFLRSSGLTIVGPCTSDDLMKDGHTIRWGRSAGRLFYAA